MGKGFSCNLIMRKKRTYYNDIRYTNSGLLQAISQRSSPRQFTILPYLPVYHTCFVVPGSQHTIYIWYSIRNTNLITVTRQAGEDASVSILHTFPSPVDHFIFIGSLEHSFALPFHNYRSGKHSSCIYRRMT